MKFKSLFLIALLLNISILFSQSSEYLIPKDAVTVFSINNISLLQKVSVDELITYDFMEEVHQELFDGSTTGKTLKDLGLDFNQKLNVFYGKGLKNEISGFSFGVKSKEQLFNVFDDFEILHKDFHGAQVYGSFFNNLIIRNESALLIRVEPTMEFIDQVTDSIWYSRGNESPFDYVQQEDLTDDGEIMDEQIYDENNEQLAFPEASDDPNVKNYYELRDSVQQAIQLEQLDVILHELIEKKENLTTSDLRFGEQIQHDSEGIFYMDNSRNLEKANGLWYFQTILPTLYQDIQELYTGNVILGDMFLRDNSVEFVLDARYGEKLGSIYEQMNDSRFDKNVLKYIPESSTGYFTYNINLRKAYEKAYDVVMPILMDEKNAQIAMNVLTIELLNEYINKDALFGTYKGSMFGYFNGIKKIKTKKIEFFYNEETFEYGEREAEAEEEMPIFTLGISIDRDDIPEKIMKHLGRLTSKIKNMGDYWRMDNAILDAAPIYLINKNGLLILTNDEDLAVNHSNGYGKEKLAKINVKKAKKSGFMYGAVDISETLNRFPTDILNPRQNEMIQSLKGKSGKLELTSSETTKSHTSFNITYAYEGKESSAKHLLDLINTIYVVSK
ncbi:MAG: hypothetical protein LW701_11155 [Fluviicola sp.]|nr:hypothetical protein [Fluviicola sp.]